MSRRVGHDIRNLLSVLTLHEDGSVRTAATRIASMLPALEQDEAVVDGLRARLRDTEDRLERTEAHLRAVGHAAIHHSDVILAALERIEVAIGARPVEEPDEEDAPVVVDSLEAQ